MKRLQYPGPRKVMTVREVAAYLHVHPSTIYRLVRSNQIPAFHIGSDWRFKTSKPSTAGAWSNRTSTHAGIPANNFLAKDRLQRTLCSPSYVPCWRIEITVQAVTATNPEITTAKIMMSRLRI